jgi:hypothetical protein
MRDPSIVSLLQNGDPSRAHPEITPVDVIAVNKNRLGLESEHEDLMDKEHGLHTLFPS